MRKSPAEYARWVRCVHGMLGDGAIDLNELVLRCGGQVDELDVKGFSGMLLPADGVFGIVVRATDSRRRKRFTIAHELGHFCIPSHRRRAAYCVSPELSREQSTRTAEREANDFAAELLMPRLAVEPMLTTGAIDLARANYVADLFDVSTVSAALRVCELTRERAAVLYFRDGVLKWGFRFGLPYGLPDSGSAPPPGSVARDIVNGQAGSVVGMEVDASVWLPLGRPDGSWGELLESSVQLENAGEVLSVLWLTEP